MKLVWDESAWEDYLWWQTQDRKLLKRINALIKDIDRNGNEGIGKPEPLKEGGLGAGNRLIVQDLFSAIENDRDPECDMYEARTTIEMISAVFESHRTGGLVTFPLKARENPLTLL